MNPLIKSQIRVEDSQALTPSAHQIAHHPAENPTPIDPAVQTIAEALADLSDTDRAAIAGHIAALVKLPPAKRSAILTLID